MLRNISYRRLMFVLLKFVVGRIMSHNIQSIYNLTFGTNIRPVDNKLHRRMAKDTKAKLASC